MSCILSLEPNSRNAASHFELPESECLPSSTEVVVADSTLSADLAPSGAGSAGILGQTQISIRSAPAVTTMDPTLTRVITIPATMMLTDNNRGYLAADLGPMPPEERKPVANSCLRQATQGISWLADRLFGSMFRDHRATWSPPVPAKNPRLDEGPGRPSSQGEPPPGPAMCRLGLSAQAASDEAH